MRTILIFLTIFLSTNVLAQVNCSRSQLQNAVNLYLDAQASANPDLMDLVPLTNYIYNMEPGTLEESILQEALVVDFHRSLLDEYSCQTFTEVIVTDEAHPYVIGTRMRLTANHVSEFETIVTDKEDWLFDADNYLQHSPDEDWGLIAIADRSSRATLEAAAHAYFDQFLDGLGSAVVPWGFPCNRLEGGIYTGDGSAIDTCEGGVPSGTNIVDRNFVIDEAIGAVVGLVKFNNDRLPRLLPDSHLFRLEKDKIRYIHTMTVCYEPNCGYELPEGLQ